jgi:putative tryptophan/tyrosine transport system substrate-binding protein
MSLTRRQFAQGAGMAALGLLAGCSRLPWQGQTPTRVPKVAVLARSAAASASLEAFRQGLHDLGYRDGENITVEFSPVAERGDALIGELVAEVVRREPDVIVAPSEVQTLAARRVTDTIPIVMAASGDPVGSGLIASLAQPGGNITGLSQYSTRLIGKRMEMLQAAVPAISRMVALGSLNHPSVIQEAEDAAGTLGLSLQLLPIRAPDDIAAALETAVRDGAEALMTLASPILVQYMPQLAQLTTARQLPAVADRRQFADEGGLMAYGPSQTDLWRRAATYVVKILNGAKPADLPVEQPMTFDFVINLKTAQTLGLTIPHHVLLQATEFIP